MFPLLIALFSTPTNADDGRYAHARRAMVERQLRARDISDENVLRAMGTVPRHRFMPKPTWPQAYNDNPVPIGHRQTISQPYIVALMTQLSGAGPKSKVLEVGTGSGYQAAVLAEIGAEVYSIEIVETLAELARKALDDTGYERVHTRVGDGYKGWPEHAPFDAIVITAAPPEVPKPLLEQLADGGHMVVPVGGSRYQELLRITRRGDAYEREVVAPVRFVPMTGEAQDE